MAIILARALAVIIFIVSASLLVDLALHLDERVIYPGVALVLSMVVLQMCETDA